MKNVPPSNLTTFLNLNRRLRTPAKPTGIQKSIEHQHNTEGGKTTEIEDPRSRYGDEPYRAADGVNRSNGCTSKRREGFIRILEEEEDDEWPFENEWNLRIRTVDLRL